MRKASLCLALAAAFLTTQSAMGQFVFQNGDRVAIIGNALADRMQHYGWLETYLQRANPDKRLVIRNMAVSGDQVAFRPRNRNFMTVHDSLTLTKADVILAFFGYNESFSRDPDRFRTELSAFVDETRMHQYNGASAPRLVLFSPIAHQDLGSPNLPDGTENNRRLATLTDVMASVARRKQVTFVDLYYPSKGLYEQTEEPLTINGVHLNAQGNKAMAELMVRQLLGDVDLGDTAAIRSAVIEKNWCWFNRYRATDGNDIWGSRAGLKFIDDQTNEEVLQHELVMLDVMTANRDEVIWAANLGQTLEPDDSNVPDPVRVVTNLPPSAGRRNDRGGHRFVKPEEGVHTFTLEEGMVANLFASEQRFPEMVNPVQLDVDTRGRLWVAVWPTYPKWQPDQEMLDRLLILPDEDKDGVADEAKTFAFVHNPTGFTFWNGGVVVASAPNLWFLKDTDGDDVADVREVLLSGLDSADTHHSANGFDYGPDGYIYYQRGIFNVSNVETPWEGPQLNGESAMYRFNPRTHRFSLHAENPPNPHGGDFDYWGYHYATSATGGEAYQVRASGDGNFRMYKLLEKTVRPVPSSGIISSQHFPEKNNGNFIILNSIGFLGIKQYRLENKDGIVWGVETDDLLRSNDGNFRPTDFKIGDDGAIYVSDWSNPIIGHMQHNIRDPSRDHEHGRIYRITVKGRPLQESVEIDGKATEALLEVLKHPTDGVRLRARMELSERDAHEVIAAAQVWARQFDATKKEDAHHLLEVLWLHQQFDVVNQKLLGQLLGSPEPHARRAARRVRYMWEIEGKFDPAPGTAPRPGGPRSPGAELAALRDYLKQDVSPEPRWDGDVFEIHIQTVIEEMRYDRSELTVTPGIQLRLVFTNPDAMDHNLLLVEPGAAARVAVAAMKMEETGEGVERQWIPRVDGILAASDLLARGESQAIELKVPDQPGRYEYLCTFPGHWQLMRGVMHVVEEPKGSLVALNQSPEIRTPAQPRRVVEHWSYDTLAHELAAAQGKRSYETGKEMFQVAACAKCHMIGSSGGGGSSGGAGGVGMGPDLSDVHTRYTANEVLQHILDPSLEVADEYKTVIVTTEDNKRYYGQVLSQDDATLTVAADPLEPQAAVTLAKSVILSLDRIDLSPMPEDLLITLEKDEIWDLLAYVLSGGDPGNHPPHRSPGNHP